MRKYVLRRVVLLIPTVLGVTLVVFLMMRFIRGDPVINMVGENPSEADARQQRPELGRDRPLAPHYGRWLRLLLRGDWGRSDPTNRPVFTDIVHRLPVSLELIILSMLLALFIARPAGIVGALRPKTWKDYSAMQSSRAGVAVAEFFLGVLLFLLFALVLGWLPVSGYAPLVDHAGGNLRHMMLPMIALGFALAALLTRLVRGCVLSVQKRASIAAAKVLAVRNLRMLARHILPNCLAPIMMTATLSVGVAIIVETSLSFLGLGTQPPPPSWGWDMKVDLMLLEINPWITIFPGPEIFLTVLALNVFGDGLRDALHRRLKQ